VTTQITAVAILGSTYARPAGVTVDLNTDVSYLYSYGYLGTIADNYSYYTTQLQTVTVADGITNGSYFGYIPANPGLIEQGVPPPIVLMKQPVGFNAIDVTSPPCWEIGINVSNVLPPHVELHSVSKSLGGNSNGYEAYPIIGVPISSKGSPYVWYDNDNYSYAKSSVITYIDHV
jgi:hypothetical protein